jgi:hypothetical protein
VVVPVLVDEGLGLSGGSIRIGYDSSLLSVQSAARGDLISGFTAFGTNPETLPDGSGQIKIDFANATGITTAGGGSIAEVIFRVSVTADGESSPLTIQSVTLSDEQTNDIQTTGSNGSIRTTATIPAMSVAAMILLTVLLACTIFYSVRGIRRSAV